MPKLQFLRVTDHSTSRKTVVAVSEIAYIEESSSGHAMIRVKGLSATTIEYFETHETFGSVLKHLEKCDVQIVGKYDDVQEPTE